MLAHEHTCIDLLISEAANVGSIFGNGNGTILLSGVNCLGTEERLIDCPRSFPIGMTSCTHSQDVGVVCQPRIFPGMTH